MIKPVQSRMARAALGWSLQDLAREADLGIATVNRFEVGTAATNRTTLSRIRRTFEAAGLRFMENGCVCPPPEPEAQDKTA
ncbi:helix-turn-helix domain-containing protein [Paracraurococcus lichenis]|uniref:Helix-turn-helix transcriptional regulator n=1 Tax=Paracraurococcus lichenis TaxID=3064888 RepID=A0ABT9EBW6_9PROT|nr:helix-turn-helix transcriptional regulator [Paracraurococcus sp. LOR1-02]MDO9713637.1 helix-turn-helix transcriptional regulator [Paracraurococcus sp. LOR1-02]